MTAHLHDGDVTLGPERLVVEEPMEIRLDDRLVATTMRTPGHDYELAVGFCLTEGLLGGAQVRTVRYCATGPASETFYNVVSVSTGGVAPAPEAPLPSPATSSGLRGTASLEALRLRLPLLPHPPPPIQVVVLARAAADTRARQELFDETGAIHAASDFDPTTGEVRLVREDIGCHSAVDKVIGRLLLDGGLPASGRGLFVTGRATFEIVQKAWAAGFGLVAALGGPSALAVDTARAAGLVLLGFVWGEDANLYSPEPAPGAGPPVPIDSDPAVAIDR
jgi:FdhD protein